jgi:hypothetical protein
MVTKLKYAVLMAALGFSMGAMAAEKSNEVSLAGSLTSTTSGSGANKSTNDAVNMFAAFGHYFTPQLVGQVGLGVIGTSTGSSTSSSALILGVGAKYYFLDAHKGDTVPFAGARLDLVGLSSKSSGTTTTGEGSQITGFVGVSNFVSETASLDLTLSASAGTVTFAGVSSDYTATRLEVGFTQRF